MIRNLIGLISLLFTTNLISSEMDLPIENDVIMSMVNVLDNLDNAVALLPDGSCHRIRDSEIQEEISDERYDGAAFLSSTTYGLVVLKSDGTVPGITSAREVTKISSNCFVCLTLINGNIKVFPVNESVFPDHRIPSPVWLNPSEKIIDVASCFDNHLALNCKGEVLFLNWRGSASSPPSSIEKLVIEKEISKIACSNGYYMALAHDGDVYERTSLNGDFTEIANLSNVIAIATNNFFSLALTERGQLFVKKSRRGSSFKLIEDLPPIQQIALGQLQDILLWTEEQMPILYDLRQAYN